MAHKYYDSASTGATTPYESVATASTTLSAALGAIGASDEIIWVHNTSAESIGTLTFSSSGTHATSQKPQRLYGVSDFDASPGTLAAGAKLNQVTTGDDWTFSGNWDIRYLDLDLSTGTSVGQLILGDNNQSANIKYCNGTVSLSSNSGNTNTSIQCGPLTSSANRTYTIYFDDVDIVINNVTNRPFNLVVGTVTLNNISLSGTAIPDAILKGRDIPGKCVCTITNSDLTGKAWTTLVDSGSLGMLDITLINCKIPSGITTYGGTSTDISVELIKTGNADIGYGYSKTVGGVGSIIADASVYATTDPMQDGGVSISNLFASASTCGRGFPLSRTYIIPCVVDTAVTPFVEILVQGDGAAALNTDEIYITASTVTVDGTTQGTTVTSHPGAITAGSACSAGTTAYTGDGYTTERTHRIETAAITPRQNGYIEIEVFLAKASTAIYVGQVGAA